MTEDQTLDGCLLLDDLNHAKFLCDQPFLFVFRGKDK